MCLPTSPSCLEVSVNFCNNIMVGRYSVSCILKVRKLKRRDKIACRHIGYKLQRQVTDSRMLGYKTQIFCGGVRVFL